VPKKDGIHFAWTIVDSILLHKDVYPLPRVDDILVALGDAKYFTSLDLASDYWQIGLDKDSKSKSGFTTYPGLYEIVRMLFGLCNAPVTFLGLCREYCHV